MIISGPILAISIACGSFAIVSVTVMSISYAKPEILLASHYKNIEVHGEDSTESMPASPPLQTQVKTIIKNEDSKLECSLNNEKKSFFPCTCTIDTKIKTKPKYKITAKRDNLKEWNETEPFIYIKQISATTSRLYAKIRILFSMDGNHKYPAH